MGTMKINIIVPVFNKVEYTKDCIKSLYEHTDSKHFRLLIVNDGSTDDTKKFINGCSDMYKNFQHVESVKNEGFVRSINKGLKYYLEKLKIKNHELIMMLNNDVIIKGKWYENVVDVFRKNENVVAIGAVGHKEMIEKDVAFVSNSRSFYRAWMFRKLGYLDEGIHHGYYDDVDMSIRIIQAGYAIKKHCIPSEHPMGTSFKQLPWNVKRMRIENKTYVENKHKRWLLT